MPSPKAGTATNDLLGTVENLLKGQIEFKVDKTGNVHAGVGKVSFGAQKIQENIQALLTTINDNKPSGIK